jgi:hypothetical protein
VAAPELVRHAGPRPPVVGRPQDRPAAADGDERAVRERADRLEIDLDAGPRARVPLAIRRARDESVGADDYPRPFARDGQIGERLRGAARHAGDLPGAPAAELPVGAERHDLVPDRVHRRQARGRLEVHVVDARPQHARHVAIVSDHPQRTVEPERQPEQAIIRTRLE